MMEFMGDDMGEKFERGSQDYFIIQFDFDILQVIVSIPLDKFRYQLVDVDELLFKTSNLPDGPVFGKNHFPLQGVLADPKFIRGYDVHPQIPDATPAKMGSLGHEVRRRYCRTIIQQYPSGGLNIGILALQVHIIILVIRDWRMRQKYESYEINLFYRPIGAEPSPPAVIARTFFLSEAISRLRSHKRSLFHSQGMATQLSWVR
jgi:hypothetical protein